MIPAPAVLQTISRTAPKRSDRIVNAPLWAPGRDSQNSPHFTNPILLILRGRVSIYPNGKRPRDFFGTVKALGTSRIDRFDREISRIGAAIRVHTYEPDSMKMVTFVNTLALQQTRYKSITT